MREAVNALLLVLYTGASVSGLTLIKAEAFGSPRFLFGLAFYAGGFVIWYLIMLRLPLSQAFPIAAGSLIIGTQIAGWWILEEVITIHHLIGLTLILAGVLFVFVRS